jgi:hypothetical protein
LRSRDFSRATAVVGIITNTAVCGFFIPVLGTALLFLSVPGYVIWYLQLARHFWWLSRETPVID